MPSKRSLLTNAAAVLLLLVAATSGLTADSQKIAKHARVEYFKDQSTPDGIVYHSFLSNLTYFSTFRRADGVHRIVDLFRLSHDETGTAIASSLYDRFEASYYDLTDEIASMEARVLCPPGRKARTKEKVYDSFHKAADKREEISAKHLEKIRKELSAEEYEKLIDHLAKAKESFYYVKTDYVAKYANMHAIDVRDDVETICANLSVIR